MPRTRLAEVLDRIAEMGDEAGLRVANVFHAGDGNLHPLVLYSAAAGETERAEHLSGEIAELCVEMGGSLSGEHGIGTDKACSMPKMFSEDDLAVMARVRDGVRPARAVQPGQGAAHTAAVRGAPGQVPAAPAGGGGSDRAAVDDHRSDHACGPPTSTYAAGARSSTRTGPLGDRRRRHGRGLGRRSCGPVDAVLDTTGLTGVIAHNPGDMTVAVRAGTPLRRAAATSWPRTAQHVALDAARVADGATVGGLLATGDAGPSALVHGSLRDLVIGVTLVLADGTVARSGGHVIKNVAGYDLAKLVHGSYGTLAVVAEVVLRLHPVPERRATLACRVRAGRGRRAGGRGAGRPVRAGRAGVAVTTARCSSALERHRGARCSDGPPSAGCATRCSAPARRRDADDLGAARRAPSAVATGRSPCCGSGCGPPGCRRCSPHCPRGRSPPVWAPASRPSRCRSGRRRRVRTRPCTPRAAPRCCAPARPARPPAWGPPPSAVGVLRAVKNALDPQRPARTGPLRPLDVTP